MTMTIPGKNTNPDHDTDPPLRPHKKALDFSGVFFYLSAIQRCMKSRTNKKPRLKTKLPEKNGPIAIRTRIAWSRYSSPVVCSIQIWAEVKCVHIYISAYYLQLLWITLDELIVREASNLNADAVHFRNISASSSGCLRNLSWCFVSLVWSSGVGVAWAEKAEGRTQAVHNTGQANNRKSRCDFQRISQPVCESSASHGVSLSCFERHRKTFQQVSCVVVE